MTQIPNSSKNNLGKTSIIASVIGGIALLAGGLFFWSKKRRSIGIPPNAPQLPIDNPGDQSDFPAAPPSDETLG